MKISRTVSFGMGAVMALVIGSGTAYAATGGKFILGKSNSASKTTTLTNPKGTALALNSRAGTPPLSVNRTTRVPNLNADLLDGLDQSRFALAAGRTNTVVGPGFALDVDDPADGVADVIVAVATCAPGTRLTGGGGEDLTTGGMLFSNAPLDRESWLVSSTADVATEDPADVTAFAQCYNPRGDLGGAFRTAAPTVPNAKTMAALRERLAEKVR